MRRSTVLLSLLVLLLLCANAFSFATGFGAGWYAHRPALSSVVAPSPSPAMTEEADLQKPAADSEQARSANRSNSPLAVFWEAWGFIDQEFYSETPLDYQKMNYGAIRGLLGALGDPHTTFAEPPQRELEKSSYEGKFGGIGARLSLNEQGKPMIVGIIENTPAQAAGLAAGDILVEVDRKSVEGLSLDQVVLLIRGPVGTTVEVAVERGAEPGLLRFSIVRAEIKLPTVSWKPLDDGKIAYVELTFFAEPTGDELAKALGEIRKAGIQQIILDLRGNRGGLLAATAEVTSCFIREGVLLYERRHGPQGDIEEAYMIPKPRFVLEKEPLVVLVDKASASASEIVAGAIQDYKRGILIGETTFGKGSVQYLHELSDKSSLHVTAAHWLTPLKRPIHGQGLSPDIEVPMSAEDVREGHDPQLERAIAYLKERR